MPRMETLGWSDSPAGVMADSRAYSALAEVRMHYYIFAGVLLVGVVAAMLFAK